MASQYVGIDVHRRRSVIVPKNAAGEVLGQVRTDNDPVALPCQIEQAGPDPEVVLEATTTGCATRRYLIGWGARTGGLSQPSKRVDGVGMAVRRSSLQEDVPVVVELR
jgi:hypothetical protein